MSEPVQASCHCGRNRLEIARAPVEVTDCNCSICRRYGVLWAYYSPKDMTLEPVDGGTDTYLWGDRDIAFHRCRTCGCVTHWAAVEIGHDRMGVNVRLMAPEVLAAARVRRLDGAGTERYVED